MVMDGGGEERELGLAYGEKLFWSVPWGGGALGREGERVQPLVITHRADRMWAAAQESTHIVPPASVTRGLNR